MWVAWPGTRRSRRRRSRSSRETGFPQPTGEVEELEADCLVLALGQNSDLSVRCISCGNCFGCDYCKGCGLCAAECPCGSIEMEPEPT
jgi:ferredoxin